MQTFLPYPDFRRSLDTLDYPARSGNQRVEARAIIRIATLKRRGCRPGYESHPAVLMWEPWLPALKIYYNESLLAFARKGGDNDKLRPYWFDYDEACSVAMPPWLGDERLHASHRSALLRKDYDYYSRFGWSEPPDLPYYWPVTTGGINYVSFAEKGR